LPDIIKTKPLKNHEPTIQTFSPNELIQRFSKKDKYWESNAFKDFDKFGFHRIEQAKHLMTAPLPPHRKTFHDFFLLTKGKITRAKGVDSYVVLENTFCFVPAHTITFNALGSDDVEGFMCHFDENIINLEHHPFLRNLDFLNFTGYPLIHIPEDYLPIILQLLQRIEQEFISNSTDKYLLIQSYLITLFLEINRFAQNNTKPVNDTNTVLTEKFKKLLHLHIQTKQKVTDYAELLSVTPNHLNKCVKKTTDKTVSEWIDEMIILESKVLLSQSELSISEVSFKVGIDDQSYFGRFFKKRTSFTPSEYRKMIEKSEN
jgi:AraC family transcriptional regulator, transcriptional activator of pobA